MKTTSTILNADRRIFLIKFQWMITDGKFMIQEPEDLLKVLKDKEQAQREGRGIEYIKEFDTVKNSFKRVSKETVLNWANWETETFLYLQKHPYFK